MLTYAKVQNGTVVNIQLVLPGDYLDPSFTWVSIIRNFTNPSENTVCSDGSPIQEGCTYDGTNFNPAT